MKNPFWLSYIGLLLCVGGDLLRKVAMLTAHTNFTHLVRKSIENLYSNREDKFVSSLILIIIKKGTN